MSNITNPFNIKPGDIVVPSGLIKNTQGYNLGPGYITKAKMRCFIYGECTIEILEGGHYLNGCIIKYAKIRGFRSINIEEEYEIY